LERFVVDLLLQRSIFTTTIKNFINNFFEVMIFFHLRCIKIFLLLCLYFSLGMNAALQKLKSEESTTEEMILVEEMNGRDDFISLEPSSADTPHELVFAIKQLNIEELEDLLLELSTPGNPRYQQWLTFEEVGALTCNINSTQTVVDWLESEGVYISWTTNHFEYLKATANISTWERILHTKFYKWQNLVSSMSTNLKQKTDSTSDTSNSPIFHRATKYYLPASMTGHLSAIFNTVQVPPKLQEKFQQSEEDVSAYGDGAEVSNSIPFKANIKAQEVNLAGVKEKRVASTVPAANSVTIPFLNKLYKIPSNLGSPLVSQAVIETADEYFSPQDLTTFQNIFNITKQKAIDLNGYNTTDCGRVSGNCFEGNLDIQYIMGIAQRTTSIYWYSSYLVEDPFLAWITDVANLANPPQANSISWSINEQLVSDATKLSFNTEALKLTVRGVTIVVSSGDNGAAGVYCQCDGYYPSFPATSPYVTTVGATMGPESNSKEVSCQSDKGGLITSGGGFSYFYAMPQWQRTAVKNYFSNLATPPVTGFNRTGRAFPDISLIGVKYNVLVKGNLYQRSGTSASAPLFAAMISLVNSNRLAAGLGAVGFINPTLYAATSKKLFNDIVDGANKCCIMRNNIPPTCCETGFKAASGWDPVTGLGSFSFPNLTAMFTPQTVTNPNDVLNLLKAKPTSKVTSIPSKTAKPSVRPTNRPVTTKPTSKPTPRTGFSKAM